MFQCDICNASFLRKQSLQKHLKLHSRNNNENNTNKCYTNFTCTYCNLTFINYKTVKKHYETHVKYLILLN